jgi:hypothetical protein
LSKSYRVHTHVGTSDHPNFDPDDTISSESELDTETRALLYLLCPDDFPANYEPVLDDSQLAQLIHQMPENNESFLDLLRAAGPSPVKSVTSYVQDLGDFNFEFLNKADFGLDSDSTDYGGMLPNIFNTLEAPSQTVSDPGPTSHDLDLDSSALPCPAATSLDHPLGISQPNPITGQQPLITTKNTGVPRKRNSKGKLECMAHGCTKFVLDVLEFRVTVSTIISER